MRTATGPLLQRYGFTGREHDVESGLIYFRARAYDPAIGMFLQRDPIGFSAGDLNLYAYTWNDPYNWTDPSGLTSSAGNAVMTAGSIAISRGLFGAFRQLLYALQAALILNVSGDTPDNPPDNPPKTDQPESDENQCGPGGNGPDPSKWDKAKKRFLAALEAYVAALGLGQNIKDIPPNIDDFPRPTIERRINKVDDWIEDMEKLDDTYDKGRDDDDDNPDDC